jgi:hypothetical protein
VEVATYLICAQIRRPTFVGQAAREVWHLGLEAGATSEVAVMLTFGSKPSVPLRGMTSSPEGRGEGPPWHPPAQWSRFCTNIPAS